MLVKTSSVLRLTESAMLVHVVLGRAIEPQDLEKFANIIRACLPAIEKMEERLSAPPAGELTGNVVSLADFIARRPGINIDPRGGL